MTILKKFDTIKKSNKQERNAKMTNTKVMDFETTPFKAGKVKDMKKNVSNDYLKGISTGTILWHLVKRHKFGLVSIWAIFITLTYLFPPIWDILFAVVR